MASRKRNNGKRRLSLTTHSSRAKTKNRKIPKKVVSAREEVSGYQKHINAARFKLMQTNNNDTKNDTKNDTIIAKPIAKTRVPVPTMRQAMFGGNLQFDKQIHPPTVQKSQDSPIKMKTKVKTKVKRGPSYFEQNKLKLEAKQKNDAQLTAEYLKNMKNRE